MKSDFFIDRPVFSTVLSIVIVIVGAIGLTLLPVDQYPQIVPPVVKVSASYPGADAQTVTQAVATPIEQELNGTPGMIYMESSSSNSGGFTVTVTFDISTNADLAAVDIQNRIKGVFSHISFLSPASWAAHQAGRHSYRDHPELNVLRLYPVPAEYLPYGHYAPGADHILDIYLPVCHCPDSCSTQI